MTPETQPTWAQRMEAIREAVSWAAGGILGDWKYKKEAFENRNDNDPWFELRVGRIRKLGVDEVRSVDNIDPVTGLPDVTNPRREVVCGQRQMFVELRVFSRDQEHDNVAWYIAERARDRLRFAFPRERWLYPAQVAIVDMFEVVSLPEPQNVVDMRYESEAVLELDLATAFAETDPAAVGTWIESVEVSGSLKTGVLGDIDWTFTVAASEFPPNAILDDFGNPILDDFGDFILFTG